MLIISAVLILKMLQAVIYLHLTKHAYTRQCQYGCRTLDKAYNNAVAIQKGTQKGMDVNLD